MKPDMQTLLAGARSLVKAAAPQQPQAKDMGLDMDSMGGLVSDYLLGGTVGKNRAGRAKQLARSMGDDNIPLTVNHPATANLAYALGGGVAGGLGGSAIGYGLARNPQDTLLGGAVGAGIGGLGGLITAAYKRRQAMKEIAKDYEAGRPVDPAVKPNPGMLGGILSPLGGPVRSGEADVYEAAHGKYKGHQDKVTTSGPRTALNTAIEVGSRIPQVSPFVGPVLLGTGAAQSLNAARRVRNVDKPKGDTAEVRRQSRLQKAADVGMLQQLVDGGRSLVNKVDTNNPLHTGAIGAGVGALGGLAGSALSGDDEEEKSPLQAALMGGVAGGGIGAGAGMLNQQRSQLQPPGQLADAPPSVVAAGRQPIAPAVPPPVATPPAATPPVATLPAATAPTGGNGGLLSGFIDRMQAETRKLTPEAEAQRAKTRNAAGGVR